MRVANDTEQQFEQLVQAVSLEKKTDAEWWAEQYEIERAAALAIKSAEPFSETRDRITQKAYETVDKLICAHNCQNNVTTIAYGASAYCIDLIEQLLQYLQKKKRHIRFFEAGVGGGYILSALRHYPNVSINGCDVYLDRKLLGDLADCCIEAPLCKALLQLEDGSIDLFYWNDVMEHLPEDEIDATLKLIADKLSPDGLFVTITPCRGMGPHDITRLAAPAETEARGLHLREYCYYEVLEKNKKAGLTPKIYAERCGKTCKLEYAQGAQHCWAHATAEKCSFLLCKNIPVIANRSIRRRVMRRFGTVSIVITGK